ncbi:MAG: T9SS type A sorting domain-containing protein [Flavobacteriales bacterium]|jgi:hypothetical protein|nr:T9SS type A sorting domain-containing protein [Flavobacteriales bacterium]
MRALTLPALLLSASLAAQTFTAADAVPPNGTYEFSRFYTDASEWSDVDTVGAGLTWNMSGLTWEYDEPFTLTVMPAAASEFAGLAPDATTCLLEPIPGDIELHYFYRNASDMLEAIGVVGFVPGLTPGLEGTCPRLLLNYPASLGSVIPPGLEGCDFTLGVESVERKVLATGTLVLPFASLPNMALIRTSICVLDIVDPKGDEGVSCSHSYQWFAPNNLLRPVLSVYMENEQWLNADLEVPSALTSVGELHVNAAHITLAPNPTSDLLMLSTTNGQALGEVRIHAADGRVVRELGPVALDRLTVDVQDLKPGVYTVSCNTGALPVVLRFVKE